MTTRRPEPKRTYEEIDLAAVSTADLREELAERGYESYTSSDDAVDEADTSALIAVLAKRGYEVADSDEPSLPEFAEFVRRRHEQHPNGTILVCRDDVCDAWVRMGDPA